jgi:hypothetical protein
MKILLIFMTIFTILLPTLLTVLLYATLLYVAVQILVRL